MAVIAGGNYNLSDMQQDGKALANAALTLKQLTAVIKAKWDRIAPADIATMNPNYPDAQNVAQKLKDMLAEVATMTAAFTPVATYDVADSNPLK